MQGASTRPRGAHAVAVMTDDLLVNVFRRLTSRQDKCAASLVCKRWMRAFFNARRTCHIWKTDVIPSLLRQCPQLISINCSGTVHMEDDHVVALAERYGSELVTLDLTNNKKITERGLRALGSHSTGLRTLSLAAGTFGDMALLKAALPSLEVLKLTNCRAITEFGITCIAARCKNLKELSLHWCIGITDDAIEVLVINCRQLAVLDLAYTRVTERAMVALATAPALKTLVLSACPLVDDSSLVALSKGCKSLEVLDVSGCVLVSDSGLGALCTSGVPLKKLLASVCQQISDGIFPHLARLASLSTLKLDLNAITDQGLTAYADACSSRASDPPNEPWHTSMLELSVPRCTGITDVGLLAVLKGWPLLQRLNVTCAANVTDAVLLSLSKHCRDLRALHMEGCKAVTTAGLKSLVSACTRIEQLDLTDCNLTEEGLLAVASCKHLQSLKLGFCSSVSESVLESIGNNCAQLQNLDLYWCSGFGARGLGRIGTGCTKLEILNVSYCLQGCTDSSLAAFCLGARALKNLEMRGCKSVTSLGLAAIASGCQALEELDLKKCKGIQDVGLIAISQGCAYLRQVNLSYCPVGDEGLKALAAMSCMVKFNLVHCHKLTIPGLCEAFKRCSALRKVKLLTSLRSQLPQETVAELEARGCFFRWMDKPPERVDTDEASYAISL